MRKYLSLSVLLFLATLAWGQASADQRSVSEKGYEYINYTNNQGPHPQKGDYAYYHAQIRNGDTILFSSRAIADNIPNIKIGDAEAQGEDRSPVEDVLLQLAVGDSVTIFLPLDNETGTLPGFDEAEFMPYDVVLLEIKDERAYQMHLAEAEKVKKRVRAREPLIKAKVEQVAAQYAEGKLADQLIETPTGLTYLIHQVGDGPKPPVNELVNVHYYGALLDGTPFDNSFKRGTPFVFELGAGQVIKGWDEGIALLNKGGAATLFIPAELAYGAKGAPPVIPPNAKLIFYVEVIQD
ncbi:MAG: FKBP-type peptidyl-prolyl cis-trans isomerase [Bacteroidota bacterium]